MGLLDAFGRFGHRVVNGIDNAAYNSLGTGLLGDVIAPQQAQPQSGLMAPSADPGSGEAPEYDGGPPGAQQQQPQSPQRWMPDAQQKSQLRGQYLAAIGSALSRAGAGHPLDLSSALQGYQQNAVGQIQAGQQAAQANQHRQAVAQFQQEIQRAGGNEQAVQQVLMKYSTVLGPAETKAYADLHHSFAPKEDEVVGAPFPGVGADGKPGLFQHTKSGKTIPIQGAAPPRANVQVTGNGVLYDPETGITAPHTVMVDGKPTTVKLNARSGSYTLADGTPVPATSQISPYEKPAAAPRLADNTLLDLRAQGKQTGDARIDALAPAEARAALNRLKPPPGASITNNYGPPAGGGGPNPTIAAMANYSIPVPTPRSSSPASVAEYTRLIGEIRKVNPSYDATTFPTAQKTVNAFNNGNEAHQVNAINTAAGHVGVLAQAAKALDSGDITVLNRIANAYGAATGNDKLSVYKTIVNRLAPEITRSYVGAGGGEGDRVAAASDFDPSLGTKRILANLGATSQLFNSKINALGHQYEKGAPGRKFEGYITPEAQGVFDSLKAQQQQQNPRAGYIAGHIYGGRTFLGGDPNTAANWR